MKIQQAYLIGTDNGDDVLTMTTWLDVSPKLKQGAKIRLKDFKPEMWWTVQELYDDVREADEFDWHRKWDNNI